MKARCLGEARLGLPSDSYEASPGSGVPAAPEALADQCRACRRRKLGEATIIRPMIEIGVPRRLDNCPLPVMGRICEVDSYMLRDLWPRRMSPYHVREPACIAGRTWSRSLQPVNCLLGSISRERDWESRHNYDTLIGRILYSMPMEAV